MTTRIAITAAEVRDVAKADSKYDVETASGEELRAMVGEAQNNLFATKKRMAALKAELARLEAEAAEYEEQASAAMMEILSR